MTAPDRARLKKQTRSWREIGLCDDPNPAACRFCQGQEDEHADVRALLDALDRYEEVLREIEVEAPFDSYFAVLAREALGWIGDTE